MEKLKELVIAYIGKTQGKTPEEVSSLLFKKEADTEVVNTEALNGLYEWDKTRIATQTQKFETERKETYDKGYNKAKAESLSKFEKDLRDKYQITEEKQGAELVEAILEKQSKGSGTGEPTEDQVKRSKVYMDTLDSMKKEKEKVELEWKTKFEGREKQLQKEATFKTVSVDALKELKVLNPILPEDQEIAQEWENIFLQRISEFEFEIKDGKKIVLEKQPDGTTKVKLDDHGHPVTFENIVKQKASKIFKFKEGENRKGTGNNNDSGAGAGAGKGYNGPIPKNEEEYNKLIAEVKSDEEGISLTKAWIGSQTK